MVAVPAFCAVQAGTRLAGAAATAPAGTARCAVAEALIEDDAAQRRAGIPAGDVARTGLRCDDLGSVGCTEERNGRNVPRRLNKRSLDQEKIRRSDTARRDSCRLRKRRRGRRRMMTHHYGTDLQGKRRWCRCRFRRGRIANRRRHGIRCRSKPSGTGMCNKASSAGRRPRLARIGRSTHRSKDRRRSDRDRILRLLPECRFRRTAVCTRQNTHVKAGGERQEFFI